MTSLSEAPASTSDNFRKIPKWLTVLVVLFALGGGGWFVWSQFSGPREGVAFPIGAISDPWGGRGPRQPPPPRQNQNTPGIRSMGAGLSRVQSGDFSMQLAPAVTSFAPLRMNYPVDKLINADERALLRLAIDASNPVFVKNLQLTDDQGKKLADIRKQPNGIVLSDADRDRLGKLWKAWNDAKDKPAKDAVQKDLLAAMTEVGNRDLDATRKQYQTLAAQVKQIVNDQQLMKYRQLRGV
ncbi:MAG TPA: hypothetical protein VHS31_04050 [Tepidisphaeraceae bacterium]|jgi:hypothetical protein|nr:hypothetical protein [Tepidisphaeraceae bacterium]